MFNKVSRVSRFGHRVPAICVLVALVTGAIARNQTASAASADAIVGTWYNQEQEVGYRVSTDGTLKTFSKSKSSVVEFDPVNHWVALPNGEYEITFDHPLSAKRGPFRAIVDRDSLSVIWAENNIVRFVRQSAAVTSATTPAPLAKPPTNSPLIGIWGRMVGEGASAFGEELIFCADGTYAELRQRVEASKDPEDILRGADRTAGTWNLSGNECTREHYRTPTERIREVSEIRIQGDQLIVTNRWTSMTFHRMPDVPPVTEKATGTAEAIESNWSYSKKLKKTLEGLGTPAPKPDDIQRR